MARFLLKRGDEVVGIDNFTDLVYESAIKYSRNHILENEYKNYHFYENDFAGDYGLRFILRREKIDRVCHLAAHANVYPSIDHPAEYMENNVIKFVEFLEILREFDIEDVVYASSSSVYGDRIIFPLREDFSLAQPVSIYGVSKKCDELIAFTYQHLYDFNMIGLRYFTVYGPWGRPDMCLFKFIKNILEEKPIDVYWQGKAWRDFTYIDDIVEGTAACLDAPKRFGVYNIGSGTCWPLERFIAAIESECGKKAIINYMDAPLGDVQKTHSSTDKLRLDYGYKPKVFPEEGIEKTVKWYKEYYGVDNGKRKEEKEEEGSSEGKAEAEAQASKLPAET